MNEITKNKSNQELSSILLNEYELDLNVGDYFYSTSYGICKIIDIIKVEGKIIIKYSHKDHYYDKNENKKERIATHTTTALEFKYHHNYKIETSIEEFERDVNRLASGEINGLELLNNKFEIDNKESSSKDLMTTNVQFLIERKKELIRQENFIKSRQKALKELLERRKHDLYELSETFSSQLKKLNKFIFQIELYLGLNEELIQLQSGLNASKDESISFRQRILYMDVECGDPEDDGLDFMSIESFDEWLLKDNFYWKKKNYDLLIPEKKCIVVFKPRKGDKHYDDNPFINSIMNFENKKTYIFMRNGENLYRIFSDVTLLDKLFPNKDEIANLILQVSNEYSSYEKERIENKIFDYKLNIILLQGLIERTEIYPDEKYEVSLFDPSVHLSNRIKFIYDADNRTQLPTNIPSFIKWRKKINEQTEEGSRIYWSSKLFSSNYSYNDKIYIMRDRIFKQFFYNEYAYPNYPSSGIYEVKLDKTKQEKEGKLYFSFKDENKEQWKSEDTRSKGYSFLFYKDDDSDYYINYDAITLQDLEILEFYLHTRIGRENYLRYMPMLLNVYKLRKEELKKEGEFVKLVCSTMGEEFTYEREKEIRNAIVWWKLKNKWKRNLDKDNSKALRMIVKYLKK